MPCGACCRSPSNAWDCIGSRPRVCRTTLASARVLEKAGFVREGRARRYLKINGVWQDHDLFALLQDDLRR